MDFLDPKIDAYAEEHSSEEKDYLSELNRETHHKVLQPRMLSGHLQGRVLSMLSKLQNPTNILEIGTYTGYSALCLAEGLKIDGHLHTLDINEELAPMVNRYVQKAGFQDKITMHIGDALELIPTFDQTWDIVFIDADKENYINYYDLLIEKMNPGGLLIADNVLWSGKVLDPIKNTDEETTVLNELNKKVTKDERVENILLPIRDGLMVIRKL